MGWAYTRRMYYDYNYVYFTLSFPPSQWVHYCIKIRTDYSDRLIVTAAAQNVSTMAERTSNDIIEHGRC